MTSASGPGSRAETVTTRRPAARCRSASAAAPGSSTTQTRKPVGVEGVGELVEGRDVRLLGPPVVEVVGLDVGDDRGVRRVVQERAVALVGLGDEQVAGAGGRVDAGRRQVATDGVRRVRAGRLQRDRQQRGRGRLAVGAGDGDHPPVGHHRGECGRARQHPQALAHGLDVLGVVLAHGGGHDERVDVVHLVGGVAEVDGRAEVAQRRSVGESVPSLPLTATPRASMIRAMPDSPAPPMPTKCTRPSRLDRQQLVGDRDLHRSGRLEDHPRQLLVGVARDQRRGGGAHRGQPLGVVGQRRDGPGDPVGGQVGVGRPAGAPPASTTGRGVAGACSPLPIGSGTKIAGSPTAAASVTLLAPARHTTRSAAA